MDSRGEHPLVQPFAVQGAERSFLAKIDGQKVKRDMKKEMEPNGSICCLVFSEVVEYT